MRWMMSMMLLAAAMGCAAVQAPQQVQDAATHQLEDLVAIESELLPYLPADAKLEYKLVTGETAVTGTGEGEISAPKLWQGRLRAMMFRMAGLVAWSRGEPYDEQAAFAKLFPELAGDAGGTGGGQ